MQCAVFPLSLPYILVYKSIRILRQEIASLKVLPIITVKPISGRVDRASATEAVDSGSTPGRVKPKTIKIGIHSFPA